MFVIVFTQTKKDLALGKATDTVSKINLVDLAGSERLDSTGASGETLKVRSSGLCVRYAERVHSKAVTLTNP